MEKIILASSSPRRRQLLNLFEIPFDVKKPLCDETFTEKDLEKVPEILASRKVHSILQNYDFSERFVIGADTAIVLENKFYGKPKDIQEARTFLKEFSGRTQSVITGIAVANASTKKIIQRSCRTEVEFKKLSESDIEWYLSTNEWQDAAGGYKIQEKGSALIKRIIGNFDTVVGLPMFEIYDILTEQGYSFV
ncbi:Maf family protein [Treponema zioleckii]|uniref:Maf family protein n=1 Tax=Treponema zioleckii TaxID=331680 RepID=UPI00168A7890|nr:Maf family protein [Treponema zioleckii]